MKNQKGITLVALIITIIVMLILAGVSISLVVGENGVLTQAEEAGKSQKMGEIRESAELAMADVRMQVYSNESAYAISNIETTLKNNGVNVVKDTTEYYGEKFVNNTNPATPTTENIADTAAKTSAEMGTAKYAIQNDTVLKFEVDDYIVSITFDETNTNSGKYNATVVVAE